MCFFFFFQAEDGIRDYKVTGVQTCALPIYGRSPSRRTGPAGPRGRAGSPRSRWGWGGSRARRRGGCDPAARPAARGGRGRGVGRAAWRGRGEDSGGAVLLKKKKRNRRR